MKLINLRINYYKKTVLNLKLYRSFICKSHIYANIDCLYEWNNHSKMCTKAQINLGTKRVTSLYKWVNESLLDQFVQTLIHSGTKHLSVESLDHLINRFIKKFESLRNKHYCCILQGDSNLFCFDCLFFFLLLPLEKQN